ncbi:MAG: hypothetical protein EOP06_03065 [Proteobacteria bacterium]|nr:MAG: hypothetical protein EOP06_03065 [Pseudomonadota bacterium]
MAKERAASKAEKKLSSLFDDSENKVRCSLYLKESVHEKVLYAAKKTEKSMNQVVERILEKFFEEEA